MVADKTNGITKMEGVRRALKALGKNASAADIQDYVKKEFDMDMSRDHIYVARGQVRKKRKGKGAGRKAANGPKEPAARTRAGKKKSAEGGISMLEGVRRALKALGKSAGSEEIQGYLKKEFKLEMNRERITKYKSLVLTKARKKRKKAARGRKPAEPQATLAPVAAKKSSSGLVVPMEDLETVKELVKRVGPKQLQKIIDVLGR